MVFRMAVGYGLLLLISFALISTVFYVGTAGLLARNIDNQLTATSRRLIQLRAEGGEDALEREIHALLTDDRDVDTEVYLLVAPDGRKLIGNLTAWPGLGGHDNQLVRLQVKRLGRDSMSRLLVYRFADGEVLVVGRDMQDQRDLEHMIWVALGLGGLVALALAAAGAWLFRSQLKQQLRAIHRTTAEISAGNLDRRIDIGRSRDEFAVVADDINAMLDQIERLMDTARNVSNAVAHDMRTPLGRIRGALEDALRSDQPQQKLPDGARYAIGEIDALTVVLDKLLQIAEAESGVRRQHFGPTALGEVIADIVELYQPAAESEGIRIVLQLDDDSAVPADRDLIASVIANLLDNAFKYAGRGAQVLVSVRHDGQHVLLTVQDDGPGIPESLIHRVTERFYRVDASRHQHGNGLGLSIVAAVVALHRGTLRLENAQPGLRVSISLPRG